MSDTPNLLGFRIAHRAMRTDSRRLADVTAEIAAGRQPCGPERAAAIREYATKLCRGIHHHHKAEDDHLWPLLVRSAGAEIDLSELSEDHSELDPLLEEIQAVAGDPAELAKPLRRLADLLDEHIQEEERTIFPIIMRHVSGEDWEEMEQHVRKGGDVRFELPRIEQHALPEELAELRRLAGPVLVVMLALMRRGHRRRERLVFGSA
ncbi:hemerythrin domain-containing protein [Microbispora hainanensis]|uniref:Hemerythrin domain-containing protein n=1 Tax=Microbispora hainanensis TaxID=568844 RepID=A0A544YMT2_9ACTN|nr:hemerythrin domain-containing protein [Microbispora hainanensis]TQS18027.1 hemerythrin domain-containing protein [Microbispora hainanensis]